MTRINPPARFTSLKEEGFWTLEFSTDKFPNDDFRFYVLRKVAPDSYESHGWESEPGEAFALRRELVAETGITNYFVRAKRVVKTHFYAEPDGDATLERFRDWHAEGVGLEDIPRPLRAGFLAYQRDRRTAR